MKIKLNKVSNNRRIYTNHALEFTIFREESQIANHVIKQQTHPKNEVKSRIQTRDMTVDSKCSTSTPTLFPLPPSHPPQTKIKLTMYTSGWSPCVNQTFDLHLVLAGAHHPEHQTRMCLCNGVFPSWEF